jgi:hypothetical protein
MSRDVSLALNKIRYPRGMNIDQIQDYIIRTLSDLDASYIKQLDYNVCI